MNEEVKSTVQELEHQLGNLLLNKIKVDDIDTLTGHLQVDVENMNPEEFKYYYHEFSHRIRVISDFLHYVSKDLANNYEEIYKLEQSLFEKVVQEKSPEGGNLTQDTDGK